MTLTFKSTGTTEIYIVQKDSDGSRRIARAIQDNAVANIWKAQLEHPSGIKPCSNIYGSRGDVALALTHYLHQTETDWMHERHRGGAPQARMKPDRNVSIDQSGNYIGAAPIGGQIYKGR
jgi:hypothetical protein